MIGTRTSPLLLPPRRGAWFHVKRLLTAMRHLPVTMHAGDPVIYRKHPSLYGLMSVYSVRLDGRIVCAVPVDEHQCDELELFNPGELEVLKPDPTPA